VNSYRVHVLLIVLSDQTSKIRIHHTSSSYNKLAFRFTVRLNILLLPVPNYQTSEKYVDFRPTFKI
jgi:hypothetical protein